jgi:hypothetical protein
VQSDFQRKRRTCRSASGAAIPELRQGLSRMPCNRISTPRQMGRRLSKFAASRFKRMELRGYRQRPGYPRRVPQHGFRPVEASPRPEHAGSRMRDMGRIGAGVTLRQNFGNVSKHLTVWHIFPLISWLTWVSVSFWFPPDKRSVAPKSARESALFLLLGLGPFSIWQAHF